MQGYAVVRFVRAALLAAVGLTLCAGSAQAAQGLNAYRVKATAKNLNALAAKGFDVTEGLNRKRGTIDVIGTAEQVGAAKIGARRLSDNKTRATALVADPTAGADDTPYDVWTKLRPLRRAGR